MTYIDIISGFTGSGKTTLIQKLLNNFYQEEKVYVIQNESGTVKLEGPANPGAMQIKSILNGCLCCSNTGELEITLKTVIKSKEYNRIMLELSGTAQLSDLLLLVREQIKSETDCRIAHAVTVVDAEHFALRMNLSEHFFKRQLKNSSLIYLSKLEQVSEKEGREIQEQILHLQPDCTFLNPNLENWAKLECSQKRPLPKATHSAVHSYSKYRIRPHGGTDSGTYPYVF